MLSGSLEGLLNEEDGKINKAIVAVLTDNGYTEMARSKINTSLHQCIKSKAK